MEKDPLILADEGSPRVRRRKASPFHQIVVPLIAFLALGGVGYLIAKGGGGASSGGVALLDLDQIAKALGKDEEMAKATEEEQKAANQKVENVAQALQKQFEEGQASVGLILDDEGKQKLATLSRTLSQQLTETRQKAAAEVAQKTTDMVNRFREEVKPHAVAVANGRGLSLVVTNNVSVVFSAEPSVDITSEVIERMKGQKPAAAPTVPTTVPAPAPPAAPASEAAPAPETPAPTSGAPASAPLETPAPPGPAPAKAP